MFLSKLKEKIIKRKIQQEIKKNSRGKTNFLKGKITSVLIFAEDDTLKNIDKIIAESFEINKSKIITLRYLDNAPKEISSQKYLCEADFGLFGTIKRPFINDLINYEYGLLLNLTKENLFFNALTAMSKSTFKVGFSNSNIHLYNFMVDTTDTEVFIAELKKYLIILNKIKL